MDGAIVDLSGLLAYLVFLVSAVLFFIAALVCLGLAAYTGHPQTGGITKPSAFGFFVCAALMLVLNLLCFAVVWVLTDVGGTYLEKVDGFALLVWSWLQLFIWLAVSLILNKIRKLV